MLKLAAPQDAIYLILHRQIVMSEAWLDNHIASNNMSKEKHLITLLSSHVPTFWL